MKATETGWVHREIAVSAYEQQCAIEAGRRKVVGLNCFLSSGEDEGVELFEVPETVSVQAKKLETLRRQRSQARMTAALDQLASACTAGGNVVPNAIKCVKAGATLREVTDVFREEFGLWKAPLL